MWISAKERLPEENVEVAVIVYYAFSLNAHNDTLIFKGDVNDPPEWDIHAPECVLYWQYLPDTEES